MLQLNTLASPIPTVVYVISPSGEVMATSAHIQKICTHVSLSESAKRSQRDPVTGGRVYKGVTLIKAGLGNRRDKNFYPPETLRAAVEARMFEGLRAFADHPDTISDEIQPERTVRDLVGIYEHSRYDDAEQAVRADLTILKSHKWLSDTIDELIDIGHADKIGLSINGRGQTEPARRQIEEAGVREEMDVNDVKRFVDIRSNDIVTEAGAGGGFGQLLESARRAKETHMGRKELLRALREAKAEGDTAKVKKLTKALEAADEDPAADKKKSAKAGAKRQKPAAAKDEDLEEADNDLDDEGEDEVDEDADLEEAVDRAKDGTDDEAEDDEDDDLEEAEDDEDDDLEETEDDDEADEFTEDERKAARTGAMNAVAKLRAQADRSAGTREAAIKGGTGSPTGSIKRGGGSFVKSVKKGKRGSKPPLVAKGLGWKKRTTGGAQMVEGGQRTQLTIENARLRRAVEVRDRKISNMSEALRVRSSADRARKLLKESGLPKGLLPDLVNDLIGMSDDEMKRYISKTQRIIEAAADHVKADLTDDFDEIEGAGTSLRESSFGGRRDSGGDSAEDIFTGLGLTLKSDE